MPKPIKRHIDLQPISREHHHGLLLSFKIRQGFKYDIDQRRIKKYVDWFWVNHLKQHFEFEEKYIFPILGDEDLLVKQALEEHARLKKLIADEDDIEQNLLLIEAAIVAHIRFEERILFMEVEKVATDQQMARIKEEHQLIIPEVYPDEFWTIK